MGVYALGTIAGPHPFLSPGEGKEFNARDYACRRCLFSFRQVKFCKARAASSGLDDQPVQHVSDETRANHHNPPRPPGQ